MMGRIDFYFMIRFCIAVFFISSVSANALDSIPVKKRLNLLKYGGLATYTVGMIGMNQLWYSHSPRTSFHFFNDAAEWKQMDKAGHFFSAFHLSNTTYQTLKWAGSKERKRAAISALTGFAALSSMEIFDGFSRDYGASVSDLAANAGGSLLFWGQMAGWKEIRIRPKLSFTRSSWASQNPDLLGSNLVEEIIKDYNGHTHWLCADMDKFIRFPKWLNLAGGYGANNMVNARDSQNADPYRQYYLSIDLDLSAIQTRSKLLKGIIFFVSMVKLPAPTLEFSKKGIKAHALYF